LHKSSTVTEGSFVWIEIFSNFAVWITNNWDYEYERIIIKLTCPSKFWAARPFVWTCELQIQAANCWDLGRSHLPLLAFSSAITLVWHSWTPQKIILYIFIQMAGRLYELLHWLNVGRKLWTRILSNYLSEFEKIWTGDCKRSLMKPAWPDKWLGNPFFIWSYGSHKWFLIFTCSIFFRFKQIIWENPNPKTVGGTRRIII